MSRDRILRRRLPQRFGAQPIYVSPDSALSYWHRDLEPLGGDLFDFAERFVQPGSVVWDVGANVGLFASAAAQRSGPGGEVIAFEPDPFCASLIRRTMNGLVGGARCDVLPLALSDSVDLLEFCVARRGRSSNHLASSSGNSQSGGVRMRLRVAAVSLDWALQRCPAPDVVKIDVEGAEESVLAGAEQLLSEARPVILCEVGQDRARGVSAVLRRHGYRFFDWEVRGASELDLAGFSTLAIPSETVVGGFSG